MGEVVSVTLDEFQQALVAPLLMLAVMARHVQSGIQGLDTLYSLLVTVPIGRLRVHRGEISPEAAILLA